MFTRILSPLSAEPNLALARARARRVPLARLGIAYQIVPQQNGGSILRAPQTRAGAYVELLARSWSHAQVQLTRNLGAALYLDSILAGAVDGENLPVTLDRCQDAFMAAHAAGAQLDLMA